jgi:hypothetical protein
MHVSISFNFRLFRDALTALVSGKEKLTCFACSDGGFLANIAESLPV